MNAPEGDAADPRDERAKQDLPLTEIEAEKPVVKSSTGEEPEDQDVEGDKPNLPPAMPPMF